MCKLSAARQSLAPPPPSPFQPSASVACIQQGSLAFQCSLAKLLPLGAANRQEGVQQGLGAQRRRQRPSELCKPGCSAVFVCNLPLVVLHTHAGLIPSRYQQLTIVHFKGCDGLSKAGGQAGDACCGPLLLCEGARVQATGGRQAQLLPHTQQPRHCRAGAQ